MCPFTYGDFEKAQAAHAINSQCRAACKLLYFVAKTPSTEVALLAVAFQLQESDCALVCKNGAEMKSCTDGRCI